MCTNLLNNSYTAIACAQGSYCLDTILSPIQCINLLNQTTYAGIEAGTLKCMLPGATSAAGAAYCSLGFCLSDVNFTCLVMQNVTGVRSKNTSYFCTDDMVPDAIECCSGYCIDNATAAYP